MEIYKLLYIDEQEEDREFFKSELEDEEFNIVSMHPLVSEDSMINYITEEEFDAIIVDYGLMKDDVKIKYNGDDMINKINDWREDFPALILTQSIDQDDGVDEKVSSTKILLKQDLTDDASKLKRKIKSYIKHYRRENETLSQEFDELIQKKSVNGGNLGDQDLERLNFLDEKIERRLHGTRQFPSLIKDSDNLKILTDVLKDAEEYLKNNIK